MSEMISGSTLPSRETLESVGENPSTALRDTTASPDLSLALAVLTQKIKAGALDTEDLIHRIVQQASVATGAKGVALALRRKSDGAVVCCGTSGEMSPPIGTVLSQDSGLTAECLRNGALLVCDETMTDGRVDSAACSRLGVRSMVAAPVENDGCTVGVLEALSDRPNAFSKKHVEVLLTLACFAKSAFTAPPSPKKDISRQAATAVPVAEVLPAAEAAPGAANAAAVGEVTAKSRIPLGKRELAYIAMAASAMVLLGISIFWWLERPSGASGNKEEQSSLRAQAGAAAPRPMRPSAGVRMAKILPRAPVQKASAVEKISSNDPEESDTPVSSNDVQHVAPESPREPQETAEAPAGIVTSSDQPAELVSVLSAPPALPKIGVRLSEGVVPPKLKHRVEPVYPVEAKQLRLEGPVVLRAQIDEHGAVGQVRLVDGSPLLAKAAINAVRQWRYQPSELNHRPVATTTDVTVVFKLQ